MGGHFLLFYTTLNCLLKCVGKQVKLLWLQNMKSVQLCTRSTLFHNPAEDKHNRGCWSEPWCWNWGQWPLTSSHSKSVRQARTVLIGSDLDLLASPWVKSPACAYSTARWLLCVCACVRVCDLQQLERKSTSHLLADWLTDWMRITVRHCKFGRKSLGYVSVFFFYFFFIFFYCPPRAGKRTLQMSARRLTAQPNWQNKRWQFTNMLKLYFFFTFTSTLCIWSCMVQAHSLRYVIK